MTLTTEASRADAARRLFPGVLIAGTVALAAKFLSEHYGAPVMLMALLLGMAFAFLTEEPTSRCAPGIEFVSKGILRLGVALLGLGITVQQVIALGGSVVAITLTGVAATIGTGLLLSRAVGRRHRFGVLTGGAVAICGASAALAISSVLPNHPEKERDTVFTVIAVTTLSTVAMIAYPILAGALGLSDREAGVFLGATIHDVAQVVGAGYSISEEAGDTATIVKLLRVALLVPVVIAISMAFATRQPGAPARLPVPLFVLGFAALVLIGSTGAVPAWVSEAVLELSRWCLIAAIAALGMKTSLKKLAEVGPAAIGVLVGLTVILAALCLALIAGFGI
ncbi:putative sulfate exporter family transporter [Paralimibaculum aggregatum]|uniref:Sulfate exporter family transporter n=1 Tax=Paralimibaculum aggregatum TaxID=3036245 RepID=A0ABQ6LRN4_9RHOB|nr:putative sulfate exporter family transporter [Limibaculum sp. NKW23]GMG84853.1 putative sulfate exporter family transporter [Limibaculum sp. NKW23]